MFGFAFYFTDNTPAVADAVDQAAFRNFGHASARISKDAKASIVKASGPSTAGSPPHTHKGNQLRRAIRYAFDKEGAIIGPTFSTVGLAGEAHEFGGVFRGDDYDPRPFMQPALNANLARFASDWQGSI